MCWAQRGGGDCPLPRKGQSPVLCASIERSTGDRSPAEGSLGSFKEEGRVASIYWAKGTGGGRNLGKHSRQDMQTPVYGDKRAPSRSLMNMPMSLLDRRGLSQPFPGPPSQGTVRPELLPVHTLPSQEVQLLKESGSHCCLCQKTN